MNFQRQKKIELGCALVLILTCALLILLGIRHPELSSHYWGVCAVLFCGSLIASLGLLQTRLAEQAHLERRDSGSQRGQDQLFGEEEFLPKEKSYQSFRKAVLPLLLSLIAAIELCSLLLWQNALPENFKLSQEAANTLISGAAVFALISLGAFLCGKYIAGLAYGEKEHHLRPLATYLILCSGASLCGAASSLAASYGHVQWTITCGQLLSAVLAVLALEKLVLWGMDCYRPRRVNEADIPVHESRILALFTRPRGIIGNLSDIVEYQFGLKVSDRALHSLFSRIILPWAALQGLTLFALSCITYIPQGKVGLLSSGSAEVKTLNSGLYFTKPWPFSTVQRFDLGKVYLIDNSHALEKALPEEHEDEHGEKEKTTAEEINYLDEDRGQLVLTRGERNANGLMQIEASLRYSISNPVQWYKFGVHADKRLATILRQQILKICTEYTFQQLMTRGPLAFEQDLHYRIHLQLKEIAAGIHLHGISIHHLAPPAAASQAYREYLSALQEAQSLKDQATREAGELQASAAKAAAQIQLKGFSEQIRKQKFAQVDAEIYMAQERAFHNFPRLFRNLALMEVLEKQLRPARKIIFSTVIDSILRFDLKKAQPDLLNIEAN